MLNKPETILTLHLFAEERERLLDLLGGLDSDDWLKPTACPGWSVKDIAAHILGDEVGKLSGTRDGFRTSSSGVQNEGDAWSSLVNWLNDWNDQWVAATRRMSPRLLIDLLKKTGEEVVEYFESLDPYALGVSVSWAGDDPAPVWLDIAREYTERWVHHQQIRDGVNVSGLKETRYFAPVIDTFVRALPHTYRDVDAPAGTAVTLIVSGESGGAWTLLREQQVWELYVGEPDTFSARVTLDQDVAWRLFTKGVSRDYARDEATVEGDTLLADQVFDVVSIIA